eukprot:2980088-Rhodomonas_salina.3
MCARQPRSRRGREREDTDMGDQGSGGARVRGGLELMVEGRGGEVRRRVEVGVGAPTPPLVLNHPQPEPFRGPTARQTVA